MERKKRKLRKSMKVSTVCRNTIVKRDILGEKSPSWRQHVCRESDGYAVSKSYPQDHNRQTQRNRSHVSCQSLYPWQCWWSLCYHNSENIVWDPPPRDHPSAHLQRVSSQLHQLRASQFLAWVLLSWALLPCHLLCEAYETIAMTWKFRVHRERIINFLSKNFTISNIKITIECFRLKIGVLIFSWKCSIKKQSFNSQLKIFNWKLKFKLEIFN